MAVTGLAAYILLGTMVAVLLAVAFVLFAIAIAIFRNW